MRFLPLCPDMILTNLPDLPPRPETNANAAFRRRFYARWGRENAVVCGYGSHAEYAAIPQNLSIKMTLGGREHYHLARRQLVVDDDSLLILNEGRCYGSVLKAERPAWTFAVFFRPGLLAEVAAQHARSLAAALDSPEGQPRPVGFAEHLRPRQGLLGRHLQELAQCIWAGERDETWLEEQLTGLLHRMLCEECAQAGGPLPRPAQRAELRRRLRLAADCIQSHYTEPLGLDQLAQAAQLSRYHFVREFAREFGLTPHAYLTRKRALAASRLLAAGHADREWVAQQCGLGSRWSLQRALLRHGGAASNAQFLHGGPTAPA